MREERSGSQILFGYLPEQTVDLRGRVWKVKAWPNAIRRSTDDATLRAALRRQAAPWSAAGKDGKYVENLYRGLGVEVWTLNMHSGVVVEPFPEVWVCKKCSRIGTDSSKTCAHCKVRVWGQLHFVGYHECGALRAPWVPKCKQHGEVRVVFPGTASASEIRFECPVCHAVLRRGFGFPACDCGNGRLEFNVHRAASVYTPRSVVIVNPPSPELMRLLEGAGGATRAVEWVVGGMSERWVDEGRKTKAGLKQQLLASGLSEALAESMAEQAAAAGEVARDAGAGVEAIPVPRRQSAEEAAVTLAMATALSRLRRQDLVARTEGISALGTLYRGPYPTSLNRSGLEDVELLDRFPVLTGNFGFTRGKTAPGESRLVPFRSPSGSYVVYADIAETEALLVRLKPSAVARWLTEQGHDVPRWTDERTARVAIASSCDVPLPGAEVPEPTPGADLLTLVHTFAHRLIRTLAVLAGIDRDALSELLVPVHAAFFVFAAARGDFVLGGLQAVFETELNRLLDDFTAAEHRCPLDPGCGRAGGACMACVHLGEPSCRYYNRFLNRRSLYRYLSADRAGEDRRATGGTEHRATHLPRPPR